MAAVLVWVGSINAAAFGVAAFLDDQVLRGYALLGVAAVGLAALILWRRERERRYTHSSAVNDQSPQASEEEARRRFDHLSGGLLQVDPDELDEARKTDPSDSDSSDEGEASAEGSAPGP